MVDKYTKLIRGDRGIIKHIDDLGYIAVAWDNGSSLSLIPEVDEYIIIPKEEC